MKLARTICFVSAVICVGAGAVLAQNSLPDPGDNGTGGMPACGTSPEKCADKIGVTAKTACCNAQCSGNDLLDCQDAVQGTGS
jgi:hypothetical protein